ncbi:MAG TPA: hypothetical protein VER33_09230, partial [Polyangiaceae bacterium]|nr:hypothetical protein [Polyangiaceae bacterium]
MSAVALRALGFSRATWIVLVSVAMWLLLAPIETLRLQPKDPLPRWRYIALAIAGSLLMLEFALRPLSRHAAEAFRIPHTQMYPTLHVGDYLMVSKVWPRFQ